MDDIKTIVVRLSDCCEFLVGRNIDKSKLNEAGKGLPYVVGASDMQLGRFVPKRYCVAEIRDPVYSESGDLLISIVGTLGKMAVNTFGRVILSRHVCALRIRPQVSRQYVMAMVSRLILEAIPDNTGIVTGFQSKLNIDDLKSIRFVLPELVMQDWLVARLSSIALMLLAKNDTPEDYRSLESLARVIDDERTEQRRIVKKHADTLQLLRDRMADLPELAEIVRDTDSIIKRLQKIQ